MPHERTHDGYLISDDPQRIDLDVIHGYLTRSYWAGGISREKVARSVGRSLCLGVYAAGGEQVGLCRVVSDGTTFAWLCDVFILEAHRGRGLSKALIAAVLSHPELQGIRRFMLATRDAHGLYAQFGFKPLAKPESQMEKRAENAPQSIA